jgi:hypothetical protein
LKHPTYRTAPHPTSHRLPPTRKGEECGAMIVTSVAPRLGSIVSWYLPHARAHAHDVATNNCMTHSFLRGNKLLLVNASTTCRHGTRSCVNQLEGRCVLRFSGPFSHGAMWGSYVFGMFKSNGSNQTNDRPPREGETQVGIRRFRRFGCQWPPTTA